MQLTIEVDRGQDGRYIAEIVDLPGVIVYGQAGEEAIARVQVLALRVLADRLEHGEPLPDGAQAFSVAAKRTWCGGSKTPGGARAGGPGVRRLGGLTWHSDPG